MPKRRRKPQIRVRCTATGKRRWPTELEAERILVNLLYRARILHQRRRGEQRMYRCSACQGWHLTSTDMRVAV